MDKTSKQDDSSPSPLEEKVNRLKEEWEKDLGVKVVVGSRKNHTVILNPHPDLVEKLRKNQKPSK